jgi:DNA-binding SARP family transcriptional activator/pimeloyl-ACP methyl ester carboxylesterase
VPIGVLGPLLVEGREGPAPLRRRQERLLVAALATHVNEAVPVDDLVEAIWPDHPPGGGASALHPLVSRVRRALAEVDLPAEVERTATGYRLVTDGREVDAVEFQQLAAQGRARLSEGDVDVGLGLLERSLRLWRGPHLEGVDLGGLAESERARLEELRAAATEDLVAGLLAAGRHAEALTRLEPAIARDPYREPLWCQRILALYRSGRQADALAAYQAARALLDQDLGVQPGPALQALEHQILTQDAALDHSHAPAGAVPVPTIRYVQSRGYAVAWQELGQGPDELVFVPGFVSNLELQWEVPSVARFLEALAEGHRTVLYDKRGTGLSDRVPLDQLPTLDDRVGDLEAVMDAAGLEQPELFAFSEGVAAAVVLAARRPERVRRLVLYGGYPRGIAVDDAEAALNDGFRSLVTSVWGTGGFLAWISPSAASDPAVLPTLGRFERQSASPAALAALVEMAIQFDVEPYLGSIRCPTLVVHRTDDPLVPVGYGRTLAAGIPGAQLVELPGADHPPYFGDAAAVLGAAQRWRAALTS